LDFVGLKPDSMTKTASWNVEKPYSISEFGVDVFQGLNEKTVDPG